MQFNSKNLAVVLLMSLGIAACSSGGSDQPGISQAENNAIKQAEKLAEIVTYKNTAEEQSAVAIAAAQKAREYAAKASAATTSTEMQEYANLARAAVSEAKIALGKTKAHLHQQPVH